MWQASLQKKFSAFEKKIIRKNAILQSTVYRYVAKKTILVWRGKCHPFQKHLCCKQLSAEPFECEKFWLSLYFAIYKCNPAQNWWYFPKKFTVFEVCLIGLRWKQNTTFLMRNEDRLQNTVLLQWKHQGCVITKS